MAVFREPLPQAFPRLFLQPAKKNSCTFAFERRNKSLYQIAGLQSYKRKRAEREWGKQRSLVMLFFPRPTHSCTVEEQRFQVKLLPIMMPCILIKAEGKVYTEATLFKTTKMCQTFFSHIDSYQFWKENNMHTNEWAAYVARKECINLHRFLSMMESNCVFF